MFQKILVANRGEIAVRVLRTIREMGIRGVAIYSEVDAGSPHVAAADEAVALGDPEPAASYLNAEKIIAAAKKTGAQAIHPGYGFLSESAAFARAVREAGLTFIGPPPEAMEKLGNKTAARKLLQGRVPLTPGMVEPDADPKKLAAFAEQVGYPVLVKASAGGGGKGMRVVERPEELAQAAKQGSSEALQAFGDGSIYLEKYLARPRHVEFQILADAHGHVVHLGERECSIQRRHQKIIEETPSPALDAELRERMGAAAVAVAREAGYVNAGTVEFLLTEERQFYFLEVNARLQVEHPITELVTGLDLVRCQIEIAAGLPLSFEQKDVAPRGHALECRIYAEDAANGFMPSPGRLLLVREPAGPGVRVDSGIAEGFEVPVHYDPILAKLAVHAPTRAAAIARMTRALEEFPILGVATAHEFLLDVLRSPQFGAGATHTRFLEEHFADWRPSEASDRAALLGYVLQQGAPRAAEGRPTAVEQSDSPWHRLGAWDLGGRP